MKKTYPNPILDARDRLSEARALVDLIHMTTRFSNDDQDKAIGMGCLAILEKLEACEAILCEGVAL